MPSASNATDIVKNGTSQEHIVLVMPTRAPPSVQATLNRAFPGARVDVIVAYNDQALPADAEDYFATATLLLVWRALPVPSQIPKCKYIHFLSAGLDGLWQHPLFTEDHGIPITNSAGVHGPPIAEWYAMSVLSHFRLWDELRQHQKDRTWNGNAARLTTHSRELNSLRLGVLGYGTLGRCVAGISKAFGMDVVVHTFHERSTPESKKDVMYSTPGLGDVNGTIPSQWFHGADKPALHHFLRQNLDVLLVSVPLTKSTEGMLGKEEFDILAEQGGVYLVNVARGPVIKQDELIEALESENGLIGAALDVATPEPLPSDSPLWTAKNCLVTPHVSPLTTGIAPRSIEVMIENVNRLNKGERLLNLVDMRRGY